MFRGQFEDCAVVDLVEHRRLGFGMGLSFAAGAYLYRGPRAWAKASGPGQRRGRRSPRARSSQALPTTLGESRDSPLSKR